MPLNSMMDRQTHIQSLSQFGASAQYRITKKIYGRERVFLSITDPNQRKRDRNRQQPQKPTSRGKIEFFFFQKVTSHQPIWVFQVRSYEMCLSLRPSGSKIKQEVLVGAHRLLRSLLRMFDIQFNGHSHPSITLSPGIFFLPRVVEVSSVRLTEL